MSADRGDYARYKTLNTDFRRLHVQLNPRFDGRLLWAHAIVDVGEQRTREAAKLLSGILKSNLQVVSRVFLEGLCGLLWAMTDEMDEAVKYLQVQSLHATQSVYEAEFVLFAAAYRALGWWSLGRVKLSHHALPTILPVGTSERQITIVSVIRSICYTQYATMDERKMDMLVAPLVGLDLAGHANFIRAAYKPTNAARLTRDELLVLRELRNGGTTAEVASALSRTPRSVDFHIEMAIKKIGCSGRTAAVMYAIEQGLI
jgi:DNA-binding CsgD family transcriptional regulator